MRKLSTSLLIFSICITAFTFLAVLGNPVLEDYNLNYSSYEMTIGDDFRLEATHFPIRAKFRVTSWESSDTQVAEVSSYGWVNTKGVGECTITANLSNNKTLSCHVTVNPIVVTDVSIDTEYTTMAVGQTGQLHSTISPSSATYKDLVFTTSNDAVVRLKENNEFEAVGAGVATITATAHNEVYDSIEITVVEDILPSSITIEERLTIKKGNMVSLSYKILPENTTKCNLSWISSDTSVATVNTNGTVIGLHDGTATITVTTENGLTDICVITVSEIRATSVTVSNVSDFIYLNVGDVKQIKCSLTPYNTTDTIADIEFVSQDHSVATVSHNGLVTITGKGSTNILLKIRDKAVGFLLISVF